MVDASGVMSNSAKYLCENGTSTDNTTPADNLRNGRVLAAAESFAETAATGTTFSFSSGSDEGRVSPRLSSTATQYSPTGEECSSDVLHISYHELTMVLADEVEKYPCLYGAPREEDKSDTRGTLGARQAAWKKVSDAAGIPPDECQKRFKNLRDRFVKAMKDHAVSGMEPRYRYYKRLDYLRPSVRKRASFGVEVLKSGGRVSVSSEQLNAAPHSSHDFASVSSFSTIDPAVVPLRGSSSPVQTTSSSLAAPTGQSAVSRLSTRDLVHRAPAKEGSPAKRRCAPSSAATSTQTSAQVSACGLAGDVAQGEDNADYQGLSHAADDIDLFLASVGSQMRQLSPQVNALVKLRVQEVMYYAQYPRSSASDASPS